MAWIVTFVFRLVLVSALVQPTTADDRDAIDDVKDDIVPEIRLGSNFGESPEICFPHRLASPNWDVHFQIDYLICKGDENKTFERRCAANVCCKIDNEGHLCLEVYKFTINNTGDYVLRSHDGLPRSVVRHYEKNKNSSTEDSSASVIQENSPWMALAITFIILLAIVIVAIPTCLYFCQLQWLQKLIIVRWNRNCSDDEARGGDIHLCNGVKHDKLARNRLLEMSITQRDYRNVKSEQIDDYKEECENHEESITSSKNTPRNSGSHLVTAKSNLPDNSGRGNVFSLMNLKLRYDYGSDTGFENFIEKNEYMNPEQTHESFSVGSNVTDPNLILENTLQNDVNHLERIQSEKRCITGSQQTCDKIISQLCEKITSQPYVETSSQCDQPSFDFKCEQPSDEVKCEQPSDKFKCEQPSDEVKCERPDVEVKCEQTSVEIKSEQPSDKFQVMNSNVSSQMMNSNVSNKAMNSNVSSQVMKSTISSQAMNSNMSSQVMNSNVSSQVINSNVSSQVINSNVSSRVMKSNVNSQLMISNGSSQVLKSKNDAKEAEPTAIKLKASQPQFRSPSDDNGKELEL